MQTLYTIEDKQTGGIKTLLHVSTYVGDVLSVVIYMSDEYGTHKGTLRRTFINGIEKVYHMNLRKKVKADGGIVHKKISDTPLTKTTRIESSHPGRDSKGKFIKKK